MSTDGIKLYNENVDGSFTIGFPNKQALSNDDINSMFSEFGSVLSIRNCGDERGFRFIRYASMEEIEAAIEGLKDNNKVKLVPLKTKFNNNNKKVFNNGNQRNGFDNYKKNDDKNLNHSPASSIHNNKDKYEVPDKQNVKSPYGNNYSNNNSKGLTPPQINQNSIIEENKNNVLDKLDKIYTMRGVIAETFTPNLDDSKENGTVNGYNNQIEVNNIQHMPTLIPVKKVQKKAEIIPAHEIIIANIHDNFGPAYILHLLEQYNPISITKMNLIDTHKIRYCHVYFKTKNDAESVIVHFDNYNLLGKKFMVIRPE